MGIDSPAYITVVVLHIICVVVGFGGVILNGVYAARAQKLAPAEGLAVMEVNSFVSIKVAEIFVYLVPIFGFAAVGLSDKVYRVSTLWVWLSLVIYVVSLGISHGLLIPRVKKMLALQRDLVATPPAGPADERIATVAGTGKQIGMFSTILNLAFVVIIVLMVWKPV